MVLGGSELTDVKVGSFNIVTAADSLTRTDISFVDGGMGADTIVTGTGNFSVFSAGQIIQVRFSASNNGFYTIVSVATLVITLATGVLTDESAGASVTIESGYIDVTGLGFDDVDAVMMFSSRNDNGVGAPDTVDVNDREAAFSFGFFEVDNGTQCAECRIFSSDQETTMETVSLAGDEIRCWSHFAFKSGVGVQGGELQFT